MTLTEPTGGPQTEFGIAVGADVLAPLLADDAVTDVLFNGPGAAWVDRGGGLERTAVVVDSEPALRRLATRLMSQAGRRLDDAAPYADARLPDGIRAHAVLPPLSPVGTCLSLRVPPRRTFTLDDLTAARALSVPGAALLRAVVTSRLSFLVTGGTGSGKTTLLSTLLSLVPTGERIVVVEDCGELRPQHPHCVALQARPPNTEGAGGVTVETLVRQALRMRPDRLVVGEVRGAEVLDLLSALNTGHDGGCGTLHANRAHHVPARIEALAAMAGVPREAAHSLLAAAVDAVIHLHRLPGGRRAVAGIAVVLPGVAGLATVVPAYTFADEQVRAGPGANALRERLTPDSGSA